MHIGDSMLPPVYESSWLFFTSCQIYNCHSFAEVLKVFSLFMTLAMKHLRNILIDADIKEKATVIYIAIFGSQVYCHWGKQCGNTVWPNKSFLQMLSNNICQKLFISESRINKPDKWPNEDILSETPLIVFVDSALPSFYTHSATHCISWPDERSAIG